VLLLTTFKYGDIAITYKGTQELKTCISTTCNYTQRTKYLVPNPTVRLVRRVLKPGTGYPDPKAMFNILYRPTLLTYAQKQVFNSLLRPAQQLTARIR
jgi:hypothetical protein